MRWTVRAFIAAVLVFVAASVVLAFGHWYLTCDHGRQGGIDCFDVFVWPSTESAPASWLGFPGWLVVWGAAFVVAVGAARRMRKLGRFNRRTQG